MDFIFKVGFVLSLVLGFVVIFEFGFNFEVVFGLGFCLDFVWIWISGLDICFGFEFMD